MSLATYYSSIPRQYPIPTAGEAQGLDPYLYMVKGAKDGSHRLDVKEILAGVSAGRT